MELDASVHMHRIGCGLARANGNLSNLLSLRLSVGMAWPCRSTTSETLYGGARVGWRTDWLYRLIFSEVESLWNRIRADREDGLVTPEYLRIEEMNTARWEAAMCRGSVLKVWKYSDEGLSDATAMDEPLKRGAPHGRYWQVGLVRFHIAKDRKRVAFEHHLGPRYGRGRVFLVSGEGEAGSLVKTGTEWVS